MKALQFNRIREPHDPGTYNDFRIVFEGDNPITDNLKARTSPNPNTPSDPDEFKSRHYFLLCWSFPPK